MSDADNNTIRNSLIENYNAYAQGLDSKDWAMVRNCFADDVIIDYGELSAPSGDPSEPRKADDWMGYLQGVINKFDVTRHTITNHRVIINDSETICRAYLTADHGKFANPEEPYALPENVATGVGEYNNHYKLIGNEWKIVRSELVVHWSAGNMALFAQGTA